MKLSLRGTRAARFVCAVVARARASSWLSPLLRASLVLSGLVVLAIVGHSTLARNAEAAQSIGAADINAAVPSAPMMVTDLPIALPAQTAPTGTIAAIAPIATENAVVPLSVSDPATPTPSSARGQATPEDPVILNQATLEDLERLPGIGPKKAQSILALRQRVGRFRQVDDLLRVRGIGRNTLRRLRPLLKLDPATVLDAGLPKS